jgi:uncharacterized protein (TIGR03435 family)
MKRDQQANSAEDVLANVGDSLREWTPTPDEERGALDRVWSGLRWKAKHVPADAVRSVELGLAPSEPGGRVEGNRRSTVRALAAAAIVVVAVGGAIVWPRGGQVYAAGNDGLQVTLADDSQVEMRAHAEMTVARASDGIQIELKKGDIIVTAAKYRNGHLYVQTRDMTVAVVGTVFLANTGEQGSRVGVIEGEVRVRGQGTSGIEKRLRPGEQLATSSTIAQLPVEEAIAWSRHADVHLSQLELFRKGMAQTTGVLSPVVAPGQAPLAAAQAEFEEASVRECDPNDVPDPPAGARGGGANSFQMTPGRLFALCLTPSTLIRTAWGYTPAAIDFNPARGGRVSRGMNVNIVYGLGIEDGLRVRGGPDWVRNTHYTIEAVAGTAADAEVMRGPMLQALLERRFGLKMHIETEQIRAFALTIAPGGFKLKEGTCIPPDPPPTPGVGGSTADGVRRNLDAARRGETTIGPCGFGGATNGPNLIFVGAGAPVPPLGGFLGAPVIDRTDIPATARFNYVLEFKPNEITVGPLGRVPDIPSMQIAPDPSVVPPAPDLLTVLEQQFGLRVEPATAPREFIVIDAIKKPGSN